MSLLIAAAESYDKTFKPKQKGKRSVYVHDVLDTCDDDDPYLQQDDGTEPFDIDSPVTMIQANVTDRIRRNQPGRRSVFMQRDKWHKLSDTAKQTWDRLSNEDKAIILGYSSAGPLSSGSRLDQLKRKPPDPASRRVNLHEMSAYDFLQANLHENIADATQDDDEYHDAQMEDNSPDDADILVNAAKSSTPLPPGDIRRIMDTSSKRSASKSTRIAKMHVIYKVSSHSRSKQVSLVDRGANGGIAGNDLRVIHRTSRKVDVQGIDNHRINDVFIGTAGGVITTQHGPAIGIFHNYALFGQGTSIHSPAQMESFKLNVCDKSVHVGGIQRIKTPDGYQIPLSFKNGLPRMNVRPYTDHEWETLPHVILTSELEWDPATLDFDPTDDEQWYDAQMQLEADPTTNLFDEFGNYRHRVIVQSARLLNADVDDTGPVTDVTESIVDKCTYHAHASTILQEQFFLECYDHEIASDDAPVPLDGDDDEPVHLPHVSPRIVRNKEPDYKALRPFFGWLSVETIKKTFLHTTQCARFPTGSLLKRAYKSPNPALNVTRRNEPVASDFVHSDEPAIDNGSTGAVIFVGTETLVTDAYGVKTDKQFVNTLEDNIRERGAPTKLISDRAQTEIGRKVLDTLRALFISSWQSEPHQQQQNPAERRIQTVKGMTNRIMDRTGAPGYTWLLCLIYVCFLMSRTWNDTINNVPITALTGATVDISVLLRFYFWQRVYYLKEDNTFPSESKEGYGRIVGISEHVGNALTWKILTEDTHKVIYRSRVRPADPDDPNLRAAMIGGEDSDSTPTNTSKFVKSRHDNPEGGTVTGNANHPDTSAPVFDPEDLIGRTFLMDRQEDGQRFRARIVKLVEDHETDVEENPTRIKFLCSINDGAAEELITYNKMLDHITRDEENPVVWKFRRITGHQGPLKPDHPDYKGSLYNVMVEW